MVAEATSRLEKALKAKGDLKLVAYIMAGHPSKKRSIEVGKRLAGAGVAALEIGIPHSDPLADGPVIQRAGQAALAAGMTVAGALEVADAVAREGVPVVLMTYINPVLNYDPRKFAAEAAQAGVAGVIVPDLPIEEAEPVAGWLRSASLDTVFMVAPTSPPNRVDAICAHSSGFVYCVTVTGITGVRRSCRPGSWSCLRRCASAPSCLSRPGSGSRARTTSRRCAASSTPRSWAAPSSTRSTAPPMASLWSGSFSKRAGKGDSRRHDRNGEHGGGDQRGHRGAAGRALRAQRPRPVRHRVRVLHHHHRPRRR